MDFAEYTRRKYGDWNKKQTTFLGGVSGKSDTELQSLHRSAQERAGTQKVSPPVAPQGAQNRLYNAITGAGKSYGAGVVNTGGVVVKAGQWVNTQAGQERLKIKAAEDNIAGYQRKLQNKALTAEEKSRYQTLIAVNRRNIFAAQSLQNAGNDPTERLSQSLYSKADALRGGAQTDIREAKAGLGKLGSLAVDVGVAGAQMVGDAALAAATGGTALVPMAIRSFGSGAQEARQAGGDFSDQMLYGAGSAATEVLTEKMFNVAAPFKRMFGEGFVDKAIKNAVAKLPVQLGQSAVGKVLLSASSEALEEFVSDLITPVLQRATFDRNASFDLDGALYDALVGGVLGLAGGGVGAVMDGGKQKSAPGTGTPLVDEVWNETGHSRQAVETAGNIEIEPPARTSVPGNPAGLPVNTIDSSIPPVAQPVQNGEGEPDTLTKLLLAGRRVEERTLTPAEFERAATLNEAGQVGMDAAGRVFSADPAQHIDRRTGASVAPQKVKAFQFDWPEVHQYYAQAATDLLADADASLQAGTDVRYARTMEGNKRISTITESPAMRAAMDGGLSRNEIIRAAQAIVDDHGQENFAAAKRLELVLDRMLTQGYTTVYGKTVSASPAYLEEKARISGAEEQVEEVGEELPLWDMGTDGIGAADAGFDPYSAAMNEYGTIDEGENPARPIDTPKRMERDTKVSLTARTVQEAEATPEKRLQTIQDAIVGGTLSYIPVSNAEATQRAEETIGRDGWSKALNDWTADARAGMASEDLTAMGATLLNNMGNSDATGEQYVDLLFDYTAMLRSAGQAVQAARILKQLTPEGRLYCVQKTVNRINEGKRDAGKEPTVKLDSEEIGITGQAREEALQLIREIAEIFSEPYEREHGVPVEDWVTEIGKQLEQKLSARLNPKKPKAQPIAKTILNDLVQFAEERALPKQTAVKKSAADRLYNFFHNRAAYAEAWSTAQTALREKYRWNPTALAAFDRWLDTSPEQLYGDKAMRDAVLEAIVTQDTDVKQIVGRMQLGDETAVLDEIYETVARRIQPDAADASAIKNAIAKALVTISYGKPSTNTDALVHAKLKEMGEKMSGIIREGGKSKEDVAKIISDLLISEYNISPDAAGSVSENIVDSFNRQVAAASQKALQVRFGKRLPPRRKSQLEKFEELGNLGAFSSDKFNAHATNLVFQTEGVRLKPDLAKRYLDAETDVERDKVMEEIQQNIADQLPATLMEKFTALRYLFMLGNLKTQVRNVVGNIGMQPVRMVKDRIGAGLEAIANRLSGGKVQRTKSFSASPALRKEALGDFETVRKEALGSGKYQDGTLGRMDRDIDEKRRIFKLPPLEGARKLTNSAMEKGDAGFSRFTYADALAGFLQARGAKNIAGADTALLDAARNYAIRQAQQATYRDNNAFSDMIADMRFRRPGNNVAKRVANVAGEGLLPFRRTPANILVRAEEYSPLGLINTTVQAVQAKRGKATGADVIESLSKTLTGSGICALGAWLFAEGFLRGSDDEDKKQANFDRLLGHQAYSLELPGGQSYTLDWLAPASMPLFVGVQIAEAAADKGLTFKEMLSVLGAISDPMLQMSMMQGVNDALSHLSYADEAALPALVANSLVNYMTQGLTGTLFGQLERITEENRMTTYVDKNSPLPDSWQRAIGKASAKIPGWDYHQTEYIDAWGRTEDSGDPALRTFNNFFNPAYVSKVDVDAVEQELQRIRDKTGDTSVFPSNAGKYINVGEQRKDLTMEEYTKYAKSLGQTRYKLVADGIQLSQYKGMDDADKAAYVKKLYDYANETAKEAVSDYEPKDWVQNAKNAKLDIGISTAEYLALYQQYGGGVLSSNSYEKTKRAVNAGLTVEQYAGLNDRLDGNGNGSVSKSEARAALDGSGLPAGKKADLWDIIRHKNWENKNPYA